MVKEKAKKDRPQFNVTFKPKCEEEMALYTWLNNKLNPTSYIKEQLYMLMRLEQKGALFNPDFNSDPNTPKEAEEDPDETAATKEPDTPSFDLDVNMAEMPDL